jgi:DNA repair protein RadC
VVAASRALELCGDAQLRALLDHPRGAQLMAAVELGRRVILAQHVRAQRCRRVRGPDDVREVFRPLAAPGTSSTWLFAALDVRMRVIRAEAIGSPEPGTVLRRALVLGASRLVLGVMRPARAVPKPADVDVALATARLGRQLDCALVDLVVLGDDGIASLARLGMLEATGDVRYL